MKWRDLITQTSRHLHTSIDTVEEWDIDKFESYKESLGRMLKAETPKKRRKPNRA